MVEGTQTETAMKSNQEALAVWKDYQNKCLHATLDELDAWLATWGTHEVLPLREPHVLDQPDTALVGLRGTGRGLSGASVGQTISELRDEWE